MLQNYKGKENGPEGGARGEMSTAPGDLESAGTSDNLEERKLSLRGGERQEEAESLTLERPQRLKIPGC